MLADNNVKECGTLTNSRVGWTTIGIDRVCFLCATTTNTKTKIHNAIYQTVCLHRKSAYAVAMTFDLLTSNSKNGH